MADAATADSAAAGSTSDGDSSVGTAGGGTTTASSVVGVGVVLFFLRLKTESFFMVKMGMLQDGIDGGWNFLWYRLEKVFREGSTNRSCSLLFPTSFSSFQERDRQRDRQLLTLELVQSGNLPPKNIRLSSSLSWSDFLARGQNGRKRYGKAQLWTTISI